MLDVLKDLDMPVSLLVNSEIYMHCPELPAEYCKQLKSCEIVGHGQSNACKQVQNVLCKCLLPICIC